MGMCENCGGSNGDALCNDCSGELIDAMKDGMAIRIRDLEVELQQTRTRFDSLKLLLISAEEAAQEALECFDIVTQNDVLVNMTVESLRAALIEKYPWISERVGSEN